MNIVQLTRRLARSLLPAFLLVRHQSDQEERRLNAQAITRAHHAVDQWQAAEMQRALIFERRFWERHPGGHGGDRGDG